MHACIDLFIYPCPVCPTDNANNTASCVHASSSAGQGHPTRTHSNPAENTGTRQRPNRPQHQSADRDAQAVQQRQPQQQHNTDGTPQHTSSAQYMNSNGRRYKRLD